MQTIDAIRHRVAIVGQVMNAVTKQAIANSRIQLQETVPGKFTAQLKLKAMQYGTAWESCSKRPDITYSAADGYFYFLDLPAGTYTLTASLPGTGTRYSPVQSSPIRVADTVQHMDLALPVTALDGTILDANPKDPKQSGVPMARVQIEGSGEFTFSNPAGYFVFAGLEAATQPTAQRTLNLRVSASGYETAHTTIAIQQGQLKTQNVTLQREQSR